MTKPNMVPVENFFRGARLQAQRMMEAFDRLAMDCEVGRLEPSALLLEVRAAHTWIDSIGSSFGPIEGRLRSMMTPAEASEADESDAAMADRDADKIPPPAEGRSVEEEVRGLFR